MEIADIVLLRADRRTFGVHGAAASARARAFERAAAVFATVLVVLTYGTELVRILVADRAWFAGVLPDDAWYYLEIAQRAGRGQGLTFDGVSRTNGFHPLWQGLLVGLDRMTGGGEALVRAALVLELLCFAAAALLVARLVSRALGAWPARIVLLIAANVTAVDGMETGVVVLTLALLVWAWARLERTRALGDAALVGLAGSAVILARLDFAVLLWALPALVLWRVRAVKPVAVAAGALALPAGGWFVWSLTSFGHLLPVSGMVKQVEATRYIAQNFGGRASLQYVHFVAGVLWQDVVALWSAVTATALTAAAAQAGQLLIAALMLVGLVAVATRMRRRGVSVGPEGVALLLGLALVAVKAVVDANASFFWITAWYAGPQRLAAAVVAGVVAWWGVLELRRRLPARRWIATALVVVVFVPLGITAPTSSAAAPIDGTTWQGANLQAGEWIASHGAAGVYGSTDSGVIGFVADGSRTPVVNLDGLTNSYAYADALLAGAPPLARYRSQHLDFLVGRYTGPPTVPDCATVVWTSPRGVGYGGSLDAPQVTYVHVRIWDLRPCWHGHS